MSIQTTVPLITARDVDGQSAGEFWIMQLGEENGQKKLNCKKIQIDVSDRPKVELSSCNNQSVVLKIETSNPVSYYTINWNNAQAIEQIPYQNTPRTVTHTYSATPLGEIEVKAVFKNTNLNKTCNSVGIKVTPPSIFNISSLEALDFGNQMSVLLNFNNPKNENRSILESQDGGIIYTNKLNTPMSIAMITSLPKKEICYKTKIQQGCCLPI
ncbi:MAG: hypothetical protein U5M51_05090 [Emticicia sp.]|nr:hypothetical protein [Emticicia sp.]